MHTDIDIIQYTSRTPRNYAARAARKTAEDIAIAKKFDFEFFDGDKRHGFGGYRYDGRWLDVAKRMIERYGLSNESVILDVGCAKGFLLHDFKLLLPECTVKGIDISDYAVRHGMVDIREHLSVGNAKYLPFADDSFDLVVSTGTLHNLPRKGVVTALQEIERVSRGESYITVDAWRNEQERENLHKWSLTAESMMHVNDWKIFFKDCGFKGDYWWFIAEDAPGK
jgi:SAM-dependent methyltransferase